LLFIFSEVEIVFLAYEIVLTNAEKVLAQRAQDCIFALPKQKANFEAILTGYSLYFCPEISVKARVSG